MDNEELFNSALTDEPEVVADTPAEQPAADQGQPRDEHGRFAARQEPEPQSEPEAAPQAQQPAKDEAHVPSWRLREVREEAERRLAEERANWQRQFEMLQRQNQPRQEPQPATDFYADPDKAFDERFQSRLGQTVAPLQEQLQEQARMLAGIKYGDDKVSEAEKAFFDAMHNRTLDPADYHRVANSPNRYAAAVQWHQQRQTLQQVGTDPNAWFGKTLDERIASDPKFAGELMQKLQQSVRGQPQGKPVIALAPSLNRVAAARGASDEDNDASDAAMFAHALR